jgi:outer membrane protein assembly factor BamB
MRSAFRIGVVAFIVGHWLLPAQNTSAQGNDNTVLGSPDFGPSPERPIGWRGDGTGRYPGATPPTSWERTKKGTGYVTKGIAWMSPLPDTGVCCPIIVGERIFLTTEVSDLVCLDKKTGRILWIRSNPEFEGLSDEERNANPAFKDKLAPLLPELTKANDALVKTLNAQIPTAAKTAAPPAPSPAATKKREIEKKIQTEQNAIDKKLFDRYWGQAVFGFSGATPTSDGKHVCAFFTTGVSVCYDLDGKRQWIARGKGGGSEHGNFASPVLVDGKLAVWANEMRGYDVETGKLAWSIPAKASNTYGSMFRLKVGKDLVAAFQSGFFVRVKDGKAIWGDNIFGDAVMTPIVEGNTIYTWVGYPRNNKGQFNAFKVPATTMVAKLTPAHTFSMDWADNELTIDKNKNPFDRGFVASPLFVDGLIYNITQGGGLLVNDAATGKLVYRKVLPLKPRTHYWDWAGLSTSPTLAGKYIYLMDNQGTTLVIEPGKEYKEVSRNVIEEVAKNGKDQVQNVSTPIFEGSRMYYRTPGYLYCIGEK